MTKPELALQIYQTAQNAASKLDAVAGISALLETLEPKDPEAFAKWGHAVRSYPAPFKSEAEYLAWLAQ